jgi:hypothetical protein
MKNQVSVAPATASPASPRAASTPWTVRLMLRLMGLPTEEEVQERMRNFRGVFARMTPEQRAFIDAWDGPDPDVLGDPNGPKREF